MHEHRKPPKYCRPPATSFLDIVMEITELLHAAGRGNRAAMDRLYAAVYDELRRIAAAERRRWVGNETMNATALVHEAYIKLVGPGAGRWENRGHFFAVAARAMRHILVDYAERQRAAKRGAGEEPVPLDEANPVAPEDAEEVLALHRALGRLETIEPRRSQVVECRFFGGLSVADTAEALGISPATVKRDWALARVWLYDELRGGGSA